MGQKVSPHGLRVGIIKDWDSKWYADKKNFADYLVEDNKVREYVKKKLYVAGVSKVLIERAAENKMRVIVLTAKPGMVIGRSGDGIEVLKADLKKLTGNNKKVSQYVLKHRVTQEFIESMHQMLARLIPCYVKEGKYSLCIAFGCTGGHHRSVAVANEMARIFREEGRRVTLEHRDL